MFKFFILFFIIIIFFILNLKNNRLIYTYLCFNNQKINIKTKSNSWSRTALILKKYPKLKLCIGGHGGWLNGDNVVKMSLIENEKGIIDFKDKLYILIDSRLSCRLLYKFLNKKNNFIGGFPDPFDISVGGVLSIGGVGLTSIKYGLLAENVIEIYGFLKGTTEIKKLDNNLLCSLGRVGIITYIKFKINVKENYKWFKIKANKENINYKFLETKNVIHFINIIKNNISIINYSIKTLESNINFKEDNIYNSSANWILSKTKNHKSPLWISWIFPDLNSYLIFFNFADSKLINIDKYWHIILIGNTLKKRPSHYPLTNTKISYCVSLYLFEKKKNLGKFKKRNSNTN